MDIGLFSQCLELASWLAWVHLWRFAGAVRPSDVSVALAGCDGRGMTPVCQVVSGRLNLKLRFNQKALNRQMSFDSIQCIARNTVFRWRLSGRFIYVTQKRELPRRFSQNNPPKIYSNIERFFENTMNLSHCVLDYLPAGTSIRLAQSSL